MDGGIPSNATRLPGCGWCCAVWYGQLWLVGFSQPRVSREGEPASGSFIRGARLLVVVAVAVALVVQSSRDESIQCLSWHAEVLDAMIIVRALGNVHSMIVPGL